MGVLKAKRDGKTVAYRLDKAAVIVGSGDTCNIRVADAGLVARHCQILKMENGFVLRDMSGEVGTFVNGKKVKEHLLSDRDLIQVGKERFTFSISEGENTARVAVSASAAPAKSGNTGRVAAAAPAAAARSGNTARIAAPAPKTERADSGGGRNTGRIATPAAEDGGARSTGRVSKAATQRTATAQKTTGRIEGGTKKITARSAAGMGYQTSRSTFAMPSTRKGKLIAIGGVLLILAIGGIFYAINASQIKPDEVKALMLKQWEDNVKKLKPGQEIEMDAAIEAILAEHEPVRKYVNEIYTKFAKEHDKVHQIAIDQRKASKDVKPYLDKYAAIKAKPADLKAQAQTLYDEGKSLSDSYGQSPFGVQITAILEELKVVLAEREPGWEKSIVPFQGDVRAAAKKGDFVGATKMIAEYAEKYKEKDDLQLFNKLQEQREFLKRESVAFVNREATKGQKEIADGTKKEEIKKRLEGYRAGLEGYKDALDKLEAAIAGIK